MVGGVQLGVLAACVVLFVPMGMAGWHLSRNKMLFFSGALFITLAVGVHLTLTSPPFMTPFHHSLLPSIAPAVEIPVFHFFTTSPSSTKAITILLWTTLGPIPPQLPGAADGPVAAQFGLDSDDMEVVKGDLFKRHSDYRIVMGQIGMKLDFIWAPYVANLTGLMTELKRNGNYPDVLVMGSGLWHMLHITNSSDYGVSLQLLRNLVVSLAPISPSLTGGSGSVSIRSPHFFWVGMPRLINSMLNTEEKRVKMSDAMLSAYDTELYQNGMHYDGIVYEAAVHVMLNALLIESHQKL
ncbi:hypothetical protein CK203_085625 [Vitis vinifera]|uniref:Uncharacterized protein n=1 Tax=Vitis vinifera TaxID=29760 RepID=A0A438BWD7_VITVI|nr:hypothetical protein CK203_085625 [Vitis vinifera]